MSQEPRDRIHDTPLSEWLAAMPNRMSDVPVGLWYIIPMGREPFGLEGAELIDFIRRSVYALLDHGGKPVRGAGKPNQWELQTQYGSSKPEIVDAMIREWQAQGCSN